MLYALLDNCISLNVFNQNEAGFQRSNCFYWFDENTAGFDDDYYCYCKMETKITSRTTKDF